MPTNREKPSCKDAAKLVRIAGAQEGGLDLTAVQQKLASATGPRYWRSLEELAESPAFEEMLHREFPRLASEWKESVSRRDFLMLASASLALAGLSGCTKQPLEPIVPYVDQPEQLVLGKPLYFATAFPVGGIARPLLVKSNEGRPTKVEGNPQHGASLGATDVYSQASVLSLYDPERSQVISYLGVPRSWDAFFTAARQALGQQRASGGAGLRFLTETVASPTLASQINDIVREFPQARWHQWEPINRDNVHRGAEIAFGQTVETLYRLDQADVIVSLEADFLAPWHMPGSLRYTREFTARRKLQPGVPMNRLYTVESAPSLTGAKADHRLVMKASEIEGFARALALRLGWAGAITGSAHDEEFLEALARDLEAHRGRCVIIPGAHQSPSVHALAHVMNERLGNVGNTVIYSEPIQANPVQQGQSLEELVRDMDAGRVEMLVIVGGNPAYTASTELD
ncbi:MAG TPA: TAT-variant-translocated molybdopterin oxidoreductase, partial [Terriglobales bacterium]|nr:TAT-variant-translocated molybdopterin oxidoreductase [Terriglobales bacterium]